MTKRKFPRLKRRLNCEVTVGGKRRVGVVLELSRGGFFVQTQAAPQVGANVVIHLWDRPDHVVEVPARVASRRMAPGRLRSVMRGGIGCAVTAPSEDYYRLLDALST